FRLRVAGDVDRDEPHELADLRRGKPDAVRMVSHRVDEVGRDAREQLGIVDGRAALLEDGVRVAKDRRRRHYRTSLPTARTETSTPCSAATAPSSASRPASSRPGGSVTSSSITYSSPATRVLRSTTLT